MMIWPTNWNRERLGWLQTLIACYDEEHDYEADEDPAATREMLAACRSILADLDHANPDHEPTTSPNHVIEDVPL